jgi:protein tyrosine phosphatase (PTP) superfamily phosphohydrolase (DUF442 family)
MRDSSAIVRAGVAAIALTLACDAPLRAQTQTQTQTSAGGPATSAVGASSTASVSPPLATIRVKNFGQINPTYFRGAQPTPADYAALAAAGVKTVIDLQKEFVKTEQHLVERAGMKFFRIPMTTSDRPADSAVAEFLKLVTDPANQPVFVHCKGGRHRTGVMTAVYRMTQDGWTADQAYAEMKTYNFKVFLDGLFGHKTLKKFVYDFYAKLTGQPGGEVATTLGHRTPVPGHRPLALGLRRD